MTSVILFVHVIFYCQIAPRRGKPSVEALACVGSFAKAMGSAMEPHVRGLLDSMFSSGLSFTLVEALEEITVRYFYVNYFPIDEFNSCFEVLNLSDMCVLSVFHPCFLQYKNACWIPFP